MLTDEQKLFRSNKIGGTDAAAIVGFNPHKTAVEVYNRITAGIESSVDEKVEQMGRVGKLLEPFITERYNRLNDVKVEVPTQPIVHPKHEFLVANVDGIIDSETLLECKTKSRYVIEKWGEDYGDGMPREILLQCAHYAMLANVSRVVVSVLVIPKIDTYYSDDKRDFYDRIEDYFREVGLNYNHDELSRMLELSGCFYKTYVYTRDSVLEQRLIKRLVDFWRYNVLKKNPPLSTTVDDVLAGNKNLGKVIANESLENKISEFKSVKKSLEPLVKRAADLRCEIITEVGGEAIICGNDGNTISCIKKRARKIFDRSNFERDHGVIDNCYYKNSECLQISYK